MSPTLLLARIPTAVYLSAFIALALAQIYLLRDTVMGDAFIHFVFARGIAEGAPFFYNGTFSAGSTSPLWSLLLAPVWQLFDDGIVVGVKVFASVFVATTIVLTYALAERITKSRALALMTSGLFATSFVLPFWAAKGMETPLAVTLVLGTFLAYLRVVERPAKHFDWYGVGHEVWLGILLGLTILVRPEGWILAAIIGSVLVWRRHFRSVATVGIPALLVIAPYYALVFAHTGQIFPSSMARVLHARQFVHETVGIFWTTEIFKILVTKLAILTPFFGYFVWRYARKNDDGLAHMSGAPGALHELSRAFTNALGVTRVRDRFVVFAPIFAWLAFHLVFFTFVMPMTQGYRYLLPVLPFFYTLALLGVWRISNRRMFIGTLITIIVVSLGISGWQLARQMQTIQTCEVPAIDRVRHETGEWLQTNTQPTDVIAIKEVDQSAYYSGRRVLSMDGTLNLAAVPFVAAHDQLGYLQRFQPEWLVFEEDMYGLYPDWKRSNLASLADHSLAIGESKTLDGVTFTLAHRIRLGDATTCVHFRGEYFWDFYRLTYAR